MLCTAACSPTPTPRLPSRLLTDAALEYEELDVPGLASARASWSRSPMSSWKQQALIAAPVEDVWLLLGDPGGYPEWTPDTIAVTGSPTKIERDRTFEQKEPAARLMCIRPPSWSRLSMTCVRSSSAVRRAASTPTGG